MFLNQILQHFYLLLDICLKVNKSAEGFDLETLKLLQSLNLKNFYEIYNFYYNQNGILKAYTMKYYQSDEIDILTEKQSYTINNLYDLFLAVCILNKNNILISDTHSENVILSKEKITIIDADLYRINRFFQKLSLELHNLDALRSLFENLYIYALKKYHNEYYNETAVYRIKSLFQVYSTSQINGTLKTLSKYKYPIDYIRNRVK